MARALRIERLGGWYHVTARGNERKSIFRDDPDRHHFLEVLAEIKLRELADAVELGHYGVVATNTQRYERRLERDRAEKLRLEQVVKLLNCEI